MTDGLRRTDDGHYLIDGGDLACGELLLRLVSLLTQVPEGATVRIVATDFAAPIDIPAWCHLTGHQYLGAGVQHDRRPHYEFTVAAGARATRPGQPWHLQTTSTPNPKGPASS
jgi:tRNA 2-thiouridine synthesizing protein A